MEPNTALDAIHYESVNQRMDFLAGMVRERYSRQAWKDMALKVFGAEMGQNPQRDLQAMYDFVTSSLHYSEDPDGIDIFRTAEAAVQQGTGDCDEQSQLVAILAKAAGYSVKLRAASFKPRRYTHVYPLVWANGKWTAVDVTFKRGVDKEARSLDHIDVEV